MPKVSVIIPNYNHAKYLNHRIDSVLEQTYQDFELIIFDDCSPDNSREVIEQYRNHPKVSHIVFNETNSGSTFKQWEKGIEMARGEYIWIAESDDWSDKEFLMTLVSQLDKHPNAAVAFSQSYLVDENSNIKVSGIKGVDDIWKKSVVLNKTDALQQFVWHTQIINASSVVFRKYQYTLISNKLYKQYKFCGDWMFWIQLLENGELIYESKELNYFRQHTNNVRGRNAVNSIEILEQLRIFSYLQQNHKNLVSKKASNRFEERLKYRLYVKICQQLKGKNVVKLRASLFKSLVKFPALFYSLPGLFVQQKLKK
jgi:glycosyltransferase involved in cell wall biosynthesis